MAVKNIILKDADGDYVIPYVGIPPQTGNAGKVLGTNGESLDFVEKQDTISDLATIRSGAALGATSVQPSALNNYVTTDTAQDITGLKTIKNQLKIQSGYGDGALFIGANVAATTLTNGTRKLARVNMPTNEDITLPMTIISGDTLGDSRSTIGQTGGIWNRIEFGGRTGATGNTSPDGVAFCVAKVHNSKLLTDKVYALEMSATQARFNVQPKYNNENLATETYVTSQGYITSSELSSYALKADLNGKADADLSNINTSGKSFASSLAMPSSKYIDLTLGASGSTYTAPANGWILCTLSVQANGYIRVQNFWAQSNNVDDSYVSIFYPITKGESVSIEYTKYLSTIFFRFIYAEGEENV